MEREIARLARRRQNQLFALIIGFMLVAPILGFVVATLADDSGPSHHTSTPLILVLVLLPGLLIPALFAAMLLIGRRRGVQWLQPSALWGVDRASRRRIGKAVRRGEHLTGTEEEIARETAQRITRQRWIGWLLSAVAVAQVALWLSTEHHDALQNLVTIAWIIAGCIGPISTRRTTGQARRYLAQPPDAVGAGPDKRCT